MQPPNTSAVVLAWVIARERLTNLALMLALGLGLGLSSTTAIAQAEGTPRPTPTPTACTPQDTHRLTLLAPGLWVWEGQAQEVSPSNGGHVTTTVVWVDAQQRATVLDPGPSLRHGQQLQRAIRCQLQAQVAGIINSHAHAENVLANSAFHGPKAPPIWATARTRQSMQERCEGCLAYLTQLTTPPGGTQSAALAGTGYVVPTHTLAQGTLPPTLSLPNGPWQVLEFAHAHTESDLVLWQPGQRWLVAAGLVYQQRLPELAQGSLLGWIAALQQLQTLKPRQVVGQGVYGPEAIDQTLGYLCGLATQVWDAMERGGSAADADQLVLPGYAHWAGYRERQRFNAQRAWRELEPRWMAGEAPKCSVPHVGR